MAFPHNKPTLLNKNPSLILAVSCVGIFIAALDQTVIYGALSDMMPDLNITILELDRAAWIVVAYLIGYTFAMPLMARISDVYGHCRIYILSLLLFMVGSILVAVAPNLEWIIIARVIQAIGGGAMVPIAMAIVGDVYPQGKRAIPLGIIGGVVEGGSALGPFYGGAIVELLDWRWIFWINLPISMISIALLFFLLRSKSGTRVRVDYIGGILLAAGLAFLSLALSQRPEQFDSYVYTLTVSLMSAICFCSFTFRELRTDEPLIRLSLFRNIAFSAANVTSLITGAALIMALVNVPLMSQTILGASPIEGGLMLFRLTILMCIGAIGGGFLCRFFGCRIPTVVGLLLSAVGFFFLSRWGLDITDPYMTLHLIITGLGFGLVIAPLATIVVDSVMEKYRAIGSSIVVMTRMTGMIIGLAALSTWGMGQFHTMTAGMSIEQIVGSPDEVVEVALQLFHDFFTASIYICLIGIVPALLLRQKKSRIVDKRQ